MRNKWIIFLFAFLSYNVMASAKGDIKVTFDTEKGSFSIIDTRDNSVVIENAGIGFVTAPYVELFDLEDDEIETDVPATSFKSSACQCSVIGDKTLVCKKKGVGELRVNFSNDNEYHFLKMSFSFKNLGADPIRLRRIDMIDGNYFPELDKSALKSLGGASSGGKTEIISDLTKEKTENNSLSYIASGNKDHSLVLGGLTYVDYRKFVSMEKDRITLYAEDPVGKRVDPDTEYRSGDFFYVNFLVDNPFEALERYSYICKEIRKIHLTYYTFPSTCMWFLSVRHFGNDFGAENSSLGAVREMEHIARSGFLKYSPVCVRLVPDCYEQDNENGWWDDAHWYLHGRKERCIVDRHYKPPYETTKKWTSAVSQLGGIPITYFQPGIRSEDYAECFPEHMLYNKQRKFVLVKGEIVPEPHPVMGISGITSFDIKGRKDPGYGKLYAEGYDYTDSSFYNYMAQKYRQLRADGLKGVFYDYPDRAFNPRGGFEDRYATALYAYNNVFKLAYENLGSDSYLQERLGIGSDATLNYVASVRTAGDNNVLNPAIVNRMALRWYKNRTLTNYDMDGKALLKRSLSFKGITPLERRSILTVCYTVTGRLLLTESFRHFDKSALWDLSRLYPAHATTLTARPLKAFVEEASTLFDFNISDDWHQLVMYNNTDAEKKLTAKISGRTTDGAMGLDADSEYYVYDFWKNAFVGKFKGGSTIEQTLEATEARMYSVHKVTSFPQWISTNRHLLQGYVDMKQKPEWRSSEKSLSGISSVVQGEDYVITVATNGYTPISATASDNAKISFKERGNQLVDVTISSYSSKDISWNLKFK